MRTLGHPAPASEPSASLFKEGQLPIFRKQQGSPPSLEDIHQCASLI
jgi:hypothetical protein